MQHFSFLDFLTGNFKGIWLLNIPVKNPWTAKSEAFVDHRWAKLRQKYGDPAGKDHGGAGLPPQGHPGEGLQEVQTEDRGHCGACRRFF